jgi:hypothetical protein
MYTNNTGSPATVALVFTMPITGKVKASSTSIKLSQIQDTTLNIFFCKAIRAVVGI